MRSNIVVAAALARLAAAAPAPQLFDFAAVDNAPAPSVTGPPASAVASTSTFSVDTASIAASIAAEVTTVATASVTGASASAASTEEPSTLAKRGWGWGATTAKTSTAKTSSTAKSSSSTAKSSSSAAQSSSSTAKSSSSPAPTTSSTSTLQLSSSTTVSSSSACPTTPEEGTYCGFINPEDPCAPQPDGYGPQVTPDTVDAFEAYPEFHQQAQNAATPSGYTNVFKDLNASVSGNSYITFQTLKSYDVQGCADYCDETDLCTAFNIYIERDPSLNPTKNGDSSNSTGEYCPNPSSITNYKCSLFGSSIEVEEATNYGDYREDFQTVVVGSNAYDATNNTTPPQQPGYNKPEKCDGGAISAGGNYHMGSKFFPGPFDPSVCSAYANAQTKHNKDDAKSKGQSSYTPCNMFNAYMVKKNSHSQGTYCSLFDTSLSSKWASFTGGWSGQNYFGVESSWTYSLTSPDSGKW